ncbi:MAG: hypothetical protein F6K16_41975 [Symploca sp. SIO2B6]|nr:hypothetical protein [Symploca sp. SIO2B6]
MPQVEWQTKTKQNPKDQQMITSYAPIDERIEHAHHHRYANCLVDPMLPHDPVLAVIGIHGSYMR